MRVCVPLFVSADDMCVQGRSSRFVEDAILTKNSISAVSRIRRALLPSVGTDGETFEGIPMSDGNPVPTVQASGDDTADRSKSSPAVPAATARSDVSPASPRVSLADFEILAVIGRGGYGKVFQVRRKGSSEIYAMKSLKKKDIIARKQVRSQMGTGVSRLYEFLQCVGFAMQASRTMVERNILSSIYHPYIVSLKYAFQSSRKLFMVMDFVSGGDFFSMLSREGAVSETRARLYTAELLLALEHLHGMGIVYRDLKPENVLLDGEGHVKLTDFGLSRFTVKRQSSGLRLEEEEDGSVPSAAASSAPDPSTVISHSFCGTEQYMAPEVLLQKGHSAGVDFWSLGILLSEMMTGRHPFRGPNHHATLKNIVSPSAWKNVRDVIMMYPDNSLCLAVVPPATIGMVSRPAGEFMLGLLTKSPLDRLGTDAKGGYPAIKAHAFFRGLDWSAVAAKAVKPEHVPLIAGSEDISNFDKVFTREAPVFSEVSTGGEGRGPTAAQAATGGGGMFGGLFRKGERPAARPQSSIDDSHFRQFSYISPEFLDKQPKQGGVSEQARE